MRVSSVLRFAPCATLVFVIMFASVAVGAPVPNVVWTTRTTDTYAPDICPAPDGGFYFTSNPDLGPAALARYSAGGAQLWRLNIGPDQTRAGTVRTDQSGNVYTAGQTPIPLHGPLNGRGDVFLRKYTPSGTMLWGRQFGMGGDDYQTGMAVAADGSVRITNGGSTHNYMPPPPGSVTKTHTFAADGTPGWVTDLDIGDGYFPGNSGFTSEGTVIDSQGNSIVTYSNFQNVNNVITNKNYTAKLNAAGQVQWIKERPELTNLFGAAIDSGDNYYVASRALRKYDSAGNLKWTVAPAASLWSTCVTPSGNIIASGYLNTATGPVGLLVEYNSAGQNQWTKLLPIDDGYLNLYSVTYSGDQILVAGIVVTNSTWSANQIMALAVPEPANCTIAMIAGIALLTRRRARLR